MRSECMHFNSMLIMKIHNIPGNIAHISKKNWFFEKKLCFFIDKRYFRPAFPQTKRPLLPALFDVPVSLFNENNLRVQFLKLSGNTDHSEPLQHCRQNCFRCCVPASFSLDIHEGKNRIPCEKTRKNKAGH